MSKRSPRKVMYVVVYEACEAGDVIPRAIELDTKNDAEAIDAASDFAIKNAAKLRKQGVDVISLLKWKRIRNLGIPDV